MESHVSILLLPRGGDPEERTDSVALLPAVDNSFARLWRPCHVETHLLGADLPLQASLVHPCLEGGSDVADSDLWNDREVTALKITSSA